MYGSYGSYSSMGASAWDPLDLASTTTSLDDTTSCAFPSWPRRDSLSAAERHIPSSFLSDDDLDLFAAPASSSSDIFADASYSSSAVSTPISCSPNNRFLECERERQAMEAEMMEKRMLQAQQQREMIRMVQAEKERRKLMAKKARKVKKAAKLTAISE